MKNLGNVVGVQSADSGSSVLNLSFRIPGMHELFVVVKRSNDNNVKIQDTGDLAEAICMQYSLLTGMKFEEVAMTISDDEIMTIVRNLQNDLMDMARNNTTEVYILFFPGSE